MRTRFRLGKPFGEPNATPEAGIQRRTGSRLSLHRAAMRTQPAYIAYRKTAKFSSGKVKYGGASR